MPKNSFFTSSIIFLLVVLFNASSALAQSFPPEHLLYDWKETPDFKIPVEDKDFSEVIIKDLNSTEFIIEGNNFFQYNLEHKIIYIASEAGVEDNNKIFLSTSEYEAVEMQKARVVNSKGNIIVFDENDVKEGIDEQSGYNFNYFALDGLDIGSFVETIFLTKKPARYSGHKETLQSDVPKRNVEFELICAEHLEFAFLSTNGLGEVSLDTVINGKNFYRLLVDTMEAYEYEPISFGQANRQAVIYKLDKNTASGSTNMTSYKTVVNNYYSYIYDDLSKSDKKSISKLLKKIGVNGNLSTTEKVERFESYMKENYAVLPYVLQEYETISALLENKASSETAFIKLYANALKQMNVVHEIVLTSDRTVSKFDETFEANNFLQTALFYLPTIDQYLSPAAEELRLGFIPWEYTATYGLFIKTITDGKTSRGSGKVKYIEPLDYTHTSFDHYITVDMTEDPFEPLISFDVQLSGYMSSFMQTAYQFLSDEEKKRTHEGLIDMIISESSSEGLKVVNGEAALFGKKPLSLQIEVNSLNFTEKAGDKVLFKVGELIGEQTELYNEKPRKMPIENDYNRAFDREIKIILPEDYKVSNLDKLVFDNEMSDGSAIFKSTYSLEDNLLTISIDEHYD
ncbi:MAG: DUF3857 domain-containing protein, partial [Bacteroidetes bacterium]|nr:DUF3857 domain-containing protein [Bacteroidota bacterium]